MLILHPTAVAKHVGSIAKTRNVLTHALCSFLSILHNIFTGCATQATAPLAVPMGQLSTAIVANYHIDWGVETKTLGEAVEMNVAKICNVAYTFVRRHVIPVIAHHASIKWPNNAIVEDSTKKEVVEQESSTQTQMDTTLVTGRVTSLFRQCLE